MRWLLLVLAACHIDGAFTCETDEQCAVEVGTGTCTNHYCAAGDTGCDSGKRYDTSAPTGLAGQCVECTATAWYPDADGDGHGDPTMPLMQCLQPPGMVATGDDCDDADNTRHPGAAELCDNVDNDCNAATNDVCPVGCTVHKRPPPNEAHTYLFCTQTVSWLVAQSQCAQQNYRLTRTDDSNENNFGLGIGQPAWIGASDRTLEGTFTWDDGVVFYANNMAVGGLYNDWTSGQPDDGGGNEDCVVYNLSGWNDQACTAQAAFICERD